MSQLKIVLKSFLVSLSMKRKACLSLYAWYTVCPIAPRCQKDTSGVLSRLIHLSRRPWANRFMLWKKIWLCLGLSPGHARKGYGEFETPRLGSFEEGRLPRRFGPSWLCGHGSKFRSFETHPKVPPDDRVLCFMVWSEPLVNWSIWPTVNEVVFICLFACKSYLSFSTVHLLIICKLLWKCTFYLVGNVHVIWFWPRWHGR